MDTTGATTEPRRVRPPEITIVGNAAEMATAAAELFATECALAVKERGRFLVGLAGGSTPKALYWQLATRPDIEWEHCTLIFGDERCVPPDHVESNYGMVKTSLLDRLPRQPEAVLRFRGELRPEAAASEYDGLLRRLGGGDIPHVDLFLLGMGADAHTVSLFPFTAALVEGERLAVANDVPQLATKRLTTTFPLINAARHVLFLVTGGAKSVAVRQTMYGALDPQAFPSQGVQPPDGQLTFLLDIPASALLFPEA
jgi:6-phosphogluconolactonase